MATPEENRSIKQAAIVLAVLIVVGGVLLWLLLTHNPISNRVVAKRDLPAFTLLRTDHLNGSNSSIAELEGRYLLVTVKKDGEVTREIVVPRLGNEWLADAVAVAIPIAASTSLGGQLHVGDIVDLVTFPKGATQVKSFENLMVLSIASPNKNANVITLAIPRARRDEFALAVTGAELVLTRRIIMANQQSNKVTVGIG